MTDTMAASPPPAEPDLDLDPGRRAAAVRALRRALTAACPGSCTALLGSLAAGTADAYSDIDLAWTVPAASFAAALDGTRDTLDAVLPLQRLRADPDDAHRAAERLLFASFRPLPLFWRLDLVVRATAEPYPPAPGGAPAGADRSWSREASALANGVGVVKAVRRGRPEQARGLLARGLARVDAPAVRLGACDGWAEAVARLADVAASRDPAVAATAEQVRALAAALL